MPYSDPEGKLWSIARIKNIEGLKTVLDVGAGSGTYSKIIKPIHPHTCIIGVEIWAKYIEMFNLTAQYDAVIVSNILDLPDIHALDLTIFGDVLEHLTEDEAIKVVDRFRKLSRYVLIAIPIIEMKQGEALGNPYEVHKVPDWTHEKAMKKFNGIKEFFIGDRIGCYLIEG